MERPWFGSTWVDIKNETTGEFERKFPLVGEDLSWCTKVRELGIDVWVDPLVRVGHQKTMKLRWPQ
jgi:hypothetical protein